MSISAAKALSLDQNPLVCWIAFRLLQFTPPVCWHQNDEFSQILLMQSSCLTKHLAALYINNTAVMLGVCSIEKLPKSPSSATDLNMRQVSMLHSHDGAILCSSCDLKAIWTALLFYHQTMVPGCLERIAQSLQNNWYLDCFFGLG